MRVILEINAVGLLRGNTVLAKKEMLCPFSDRICKNCSVYIGRHYLLCNKAGYRGNKGRGTSNTEGENHDSRKPVKITVPELEYIEELDPYLRFDDLESE
jgi:hypothetical protein